MRPKHAKVPQGYRPVQPGDILSVGTFSTHLDGPPQTYKALCFAGDPFVVAVVNKNALLQCAGFCPAFAGQESRVARDTDSACVGVQARHIRLLFAGAQARNVAELTSDYKFTVISP